MSLALYARSARLHWRLAVASAALGGLLLGLVALGQPPLYQADLRLLAALSPAAPFEDRTLMESRVRAYAQQATSPAVLRTVIAELHLPYPPGTLAREIFASTPLDTIVIDIAVRDTDPNRAASIDNAVAKALGELAAAERSSAPLAFSVEHPALVPARPMGQFPLGYPIGGILGGALIGIGLGTVRPRRVSHRMAEIETLTGTGYENDVAA
jgi:polysaccharide biosynthesis transport protein